MTDFQSPQELTVGSEYDGQRLDNFLHRLLQRAPRALVYRIIRRGEVRINGSRAKPAQRLKSGDRLRVPPVRLDQRPDAGVPQQALAALASSILVETDQFLVINKPAGMAVHAGSGLAWGLIDALRLLRPDQFLELVHRLDRFTSGCLLLARSGPALRQANDWFAGGLVAKSYVGVLHGALARKQVRRDDRLQRVTGTDGRRQVRVSADGKAADTVFETIAVGTDATLVRAAIGTGRTHQIRVHAQAMGFPLLGDDKYGDDASRSHARALGLRQMLLHSYRLDLPLDAALGVTAPLPPKWLPWLERLFAGADWRNQLQLQ